MMMPKQMANKRVRLFTFLLLGIISLQTNVFGQTTALHLYNSWNINKLYTDTNIVHTAWKPMLYLDTVSASSTRSWFYRKVFNEHLLSVQQPNYTIYGDIILDEYIGYDSRAIKANNGSKDNYHIPMMNT